MDTFPTKQHIEDIERYEVDTISTLEDLVDTVSEEGPLYTPTVPIRAVNNEDMTLTVYLHTLSDRGHVKWYRIDFESLFSDTAELQQSLDQIKKAVTS